VTPASTIESRTGGFHTAIYRAALGGVLRATARGGTVVHVGNLPGTAVPAVLGDLVTREIAWISDALVAMRDGRPLESAAEAPAVAADGSSKLMLRLDASRNLA
jgi:L-idonate 5-dehydrogenase